MANEGEYPKVDGDILYASEFNNLVPVGIILPWLKSYTNTPALPAVYVECSGQTLSDSDSVYDGQVIPDLNATIQVSSTATSGGASTLTDSGESWSTNEWAAYEVEILSGTGSGQIATIVSNTGTVLTSTGVWETNPSSDSVYKIVTPPRFLRGSPTSGETGGESTHLLTEGELAQHNHPYTRSVNGGSNQKGTLSGLSFSTNGYDTGSTGDNNVHENRPPFYGVVWVMRIK